MEHPAKNSQSTKSIHSKKRIGIYSGSFNPVHIGHQKLANYLIENKIVDEVWLVISPCNPLKHQSELIDEYIRLELLILAIQGQTNIKVSDIELSLIHISEPTRRTPIS